METQFRSFLWPAKNRNAHVRSGDIVKDLPYATASTILEQLMYIYLYSLYNLIYIHKYT